jgi:hypothetical protein
VAATPLPKGSGRVGLVPQLAPGAAIRLVRSRRGDARGVAFVAAPRGNLPDSQVVQLVQSERTQRAAQLRGTGAGCTVRRRGFRIAVGLDEPTLAALSRRLGHGVATLGLRENAEAMVAELQSYTFKAGS